MSNEFLMEVFYIKIKVKGNLKNITEKKDNFFDTYAIKNKNKINFIHMDTSYKISLLDKEILLIRDNKEFTHKFLFNVDKITQSEYYIKELSTSITVMVKTTKIVQNKKNILIEYEILDSNDKYSYTLDME